MATRGSALRKGMCVSTNASRSAARVVGPYSKRHQMIQVQWANGKRMFVDATNAIEVPCSTLGRARKRKPTKRRK